MAGIIGPREEFRVEKTFPHHDTDVLGMTQHIRTQIRPYSTLSSFQYSAFIPFGTPVTYNKQETTLVQSTLGPYGKSALERSRLEGEDYGGR